MENSQENDVWNFTQWRRNNERIWSVYRDNTNKYKFQNDKKYRQKISDYIRTKYHRGL